MGGPGIGMAPAQGEQGASPERESGLGFGIEFGNCDEDKHPHCGGVECDTVCAVDGFATLDEAWDFAREVLGDEMRISHVIDWVSRWDGLTYSEMRSDTSDDPILRDYNLLDYNQPSGEQTYTIVEGDHDDWGLYN